MPKGGNGNGGNGTGAGAKPPKIANQTFGTTENPIDGHSIGFIEADVNPNKSSWSIEENEAFAINQQTGELYVADGSAIDYEAAQSHDLIVQVEDGKNAYSATITINVTDVNDAPVIDTTSLIADENQTFAGTISATDQDDDVLAYSITGNGRSRKTQFMMCGELQSYCY